MKFIDTHCHLICDEYKDTKDLIIQNAKEKSITMITCGTDFSTSKKGLQLAKKYSYIYAAIGFAPSEINSKEFIINEFDLLAANQTPAAIGECGLDYYYHPDNREKQKEILISHANLANKYNLPLILHCRGSKDNPCDAYKDLYDILADIKNPKKGVVHCFNAGQDYAHKFIKLGYYLGFNGIITFDKSDNLKNVLQAIPLESILLETDSPYLAPVPFRGKTNEPANIAIIAEAVSIIKKIDLNKVAKQTTKNAINLFNL